MAEDALSDGGFEVLRAAIRIARDEQVQRLAGLRTRLHEAFPGRDADVRDALQYWAHYVARHGGYGSARI